MYRTFSFKKKSNVIKKLYYQDFFFTVYRDKSAIFFPRLCITSILILAFWYDSWNKLLSLLSDGVENMLSLRKLYIYSLWSSFLNFRFPCTCTIYYHFMCSMNVSIIDWEDLQILAQILQVSYNIRDKFKGLSILYA